LDFIDSSGFGDAHLGAVDTLATCESRNVRDIMQR